MPAPRPSVLTLYISYRHIFLNTPYIHTPMRQHILTALSGMTLASLAILMSCSKEAAKTDSLSDTVTTPTIAGGEIASEIDTVSVKTTLMSASRSYRFTLDEDTCFLTLTADIEWPREIGEAHLAKLSDTLICAAFPEQKGLTVKEAITGFLNNTEGIIDGPREIVPASEVAGGIRESWTIDIDVNQECLTDKYVTYKSTSSSYMGGAHPMTSVTPLSYDLSTGEVATLSYLFKPGSDKAILDAVSSSLAASLGCTAGKFTEAGLFNDTLPMPSAMYINSYATLIFQYGLYEVAPYAMGIITAAVSPEQLRNHLTPAGRALFGL